MYEHSEFDWADEKRRAAYIELWTGASESADVTKGSCCSAFYGCSNMTRLVAQQLWHSIHSVVGHQPGVPFDAVQVEGETLLHGVASILFSSEPDERDIAQLALAVDELVDAGLVLQELPGSWLIHFGQWFTPERLQEHEERRAAIRARYSLPRRGTLRSVPKPPDDSN